MDGLPEESKRLLPSLFAIRDGLYSLEFRRLVQSLTGSGPLSGQQIDLSANAFGHTGHLLCHDDVIGTRKACFVFVSLFFPLVLSEERGCLGATAGKPTVEQQSSPNHACCLPPPTAMGACAWQGCFRPWAPDMSTPVRVVGHCCHVQQGGYPVHDM